MRSRTWMLALILAFVAGLAVGGCGRDEAQAPDNAVVNDGSQVDLNQPYGGLTAADEPEIASDPYFAEAVAEDAAGDPADPLANDPAVLALEQAAADSCTPGEGDRGRDRDRDRDGRPDARPLPRLTFLRITWGVLDAPDSLASEPNGELTDWSGLLRVDRGVVIARRLIHWESPYDYLVYPRLDRHTLAWVSHTGQHYDGLLVEIIETPVRPDTTGAVLPVNMLHFVTPQFSDSLEVASLGGIDETYPAGPEGNAVRFTGLGGTPPSVCPKGFLSGLWRADSDSAGAFKGRWMTCHGRLDGFLRGWWGYNAAGERVFAGKWVGRHGEFRGLLKGTWAPGAEPGHGTFTGQWANAALTVEGVLGGDTVKLPNNPKGFFAGRWSMLCDDATVAAIR